MAYSLHHSHSNAIPQQMFVVLHSSSMKRLLIGKGKTTSKKSAYFRRFTKNSDTLPTTCYSLQKLSLFSQKLCSSTELLSSDKFPSKPLACMIEYFLLNPVPNFKKMNRRGIFWRETTFHFRPGVVK
ncbi:hypothetical protein, unlikely [Trypanosoma congolense IL3000]|uniref:Uncharacterized protein n=1 Tax=Trypanosoma congolense (strain IL3000) TaxID=1068625 RepID=F9WAU2_TRYCI|nr:hypothetical protein, unlikely [Trypanosoma congolense IL3000]